MIHNLYRSMVNKTAYDKTKENQFENNIDQNMVYNV